MHLLSFASKFLSRRSDGSTDSRMSHLGCPVSQIRYKKKLFPKPCGLVIKISLILMTLSPQTGALWRQVDWEQVGALAGTGHNSPNVLLFFCFFSFNQQISAKQINFQISTFKCFLPKGTNFEPNDRVVLRQKYSLFQ